MNSAWYFVPQHFYCEAGGGVFTPNGRPGATQEIYGVLNILVLRMHQKSTNNFKANHFSAKIMLNILASMIKALKWLALSTLVLKSS